MNHKSELPEGFKPPLEMFYHWEKEQPNKTWLRQYEDGQWLEYSWQQAGDMARKIASGLQARGLKPNEKIGFYAENSARWFITDLAIMMAGLVSVPIYTSMPEDKIRYIVDHSEMAFLFVGDNCALSLEQIKAAFGNNIEVCGLGCNNNDWSQLLNSTSEAFGNPLRDWNDLWTISYTSGTTGQPKGVMHSFSTMPSSVMETAKLTRTSEKTRLFSYLPLAHMAERCAIELHSFYCGGMVGFNRNKESFIEDLILIRPTFFFAVPRIWANLKAGIVAKLGEATWQRCTSDKIFGAETGKQVLASMGLDAVEIALTGSAPIPRADIEAWRCLSMPLCEGFGQTESMSGTFNRIDNYKVGSIGLPITSSAEVSISEQGELLLRSAGNMLGYYRDEEKTRETIIDGWIHTGDKARIDEDGFLFITGRIKDIFKTAKGKYVAPAPIENNFAHFSGIEQCCLVGSGLAQTVMLVVITGWEDNNDELKQKLAHHLQQTNKQLEAHERISHVIICLEPWTIENDLLTHTLKVLRDDVEKFYLATIEQAISNPLETVIWET